MNIFKDWSASLEIYEIHLLVLEDLANRVDRTPNLIEFLRAHTDLSPGICMAIWNDDNSVLANYILGVAWKKVGDWMQHALEDTWVDKLVRILVVVGIIAGVGGGLYYYYKVKTSR